MAVVGAVLLALLLWFAVALVFRRRFQFSIRSLLLLAVAVAVPCSWMAVDLKKVKQQEATADAVKRARGTICYDYQLVGFGMDDSATPPAPKWLRDLLGNGFFGSIVDVDLADKRELKDVLPRLKELSQLLYLRLDRSEVTDEGLENLAGLARLETLLLGNVPITNAGLKHLKALSQLETLSLASEKSRTQDWQTYGE